MSSPRFVTLAPPPSDSCPCAGSNTAAPGPRTPRSHPTQVTSKFITLRVDDADEDEGLDVVDFQEYAYHDLWLVGHERFPSEDMDARYATLGSLLGVTTNSVSRGVLNGGESAPILGFNR